MNIAEFKSEAATSKLKRKVWQAVGLEQLLATELKLGPIFRSFEANVGNIKRK
jgi:hypothetical protein